MRIAIGGISHESSSFAKSRTTVRDFETGFGLFRGEAITDRFRGTNICTGGFLAGAEQHGFEPVPLLWAFAYPSGVVRQADYDALKAEFLDRLRAAESEGGPVDGALLDMHGAMVVEDIADGDGDFIAAVREALGPDRPIIVTFDLHGNHTPHRVEAADAIIGFDTYPHIDMAERGREAADMIVATLGGEIRPVTAIEQLPLFWNAACQITSHPPMDEAMRRVHALEEREGILSVTLATGFPWADVPHVGASVVVVADGNRELAQATADELGVWVWENRQRWYRKPVSVRDALAEAEQIGRYPILLADHADNTGGGAPGDSTEVLRTFLELRLQDALVLYMVDVDVVEQTHGAGAGARITVELGGRSDPIQGPPIRAGFEVVAVSDGRFRYDGPMYAGLTGDLGPSAWLRKDGVSVVVVTAREQPVDMAFARTLGIDCAAMRYIGLKSAVHFRSGFEPIAGSIHSVDAQAVHTHDFTQLEYRQRTRPVYPVEIPPRTE